VNRTYAAVRDLKLRYRGMKKNATQLFAGCALVNLYLQRKKLLLLAPA